MCLLNRQHTLKQMKVLVISPHMDDEVLGAGGTICKHVHDNDTVKVVFVADRAYEHKYNASAINAERKSALRAKEVLGYQQVEFLGLKDEQLDQRLIDVIRPMEKSIIRFEPDIVYVCHRGDTNQDHRAVFDAALVSCRAISGALKHRISRFASYEVPSATDQAAPFAERGFLPNYYVNVNDYLSRKEKALSCYSRELRVFPHPRSIKGIRVLAQKRGMEVGWPAAEAFAVIRQEWS